MWYVKSLELGPVPTLSMTAIVTSEGFGGQTKLGFGPPSDASLKKARAFGGKNYWEHMVAAERVALKPEPGRGGRPAFLSRRVPGVGLQAGHGDHNRPVRDSLHYDP